MTRNGIKKEEASIILITVGNAVREVGHTLLTSPFIGATKDKQYCCVTLTIGGESRKLIVGRVPFDPSNLPHKRPELLCCFEKISQEQGDRLTELHRTMRNGTSHCTISHTSSEEVVVISKNYDLSQNSYSIIVVGPAGGHALDIANIAKSILQPYCARM